MLIGKNIKNILGGGHNVSEVKYMDKTVWKKSIILTTFDDTRYFYKDIEGYYRFKQDGDINLYYVISKSGTVANEMYIPIRGSLIKGNKGFANFNGLQIDRVHTLVLMGDEIYPNQIRFKRLDVKLNKVLISENELSKEQVLNYFKNI